MAFQVNGVTVVDFTRTFASTAFPRTVNGISVLGSGDLKYIRPGAASNHVIGDYIYCGHQSAVYTSGGYPATVFQAGTTHAASGFRRDNTHAFDYKYRQGGDTAVTGISGPWRVASEGMFDTGTNPFQQDMMFVRIV